MAVRFAGQTPYPFKKKNVGCQRYEARLGIRRAKGFRKFSGQSD
jgi:hypothetical protein